MIGAGELQLPPICLLSASAIPALTPVSASPSLWSCLSKLDPSSPAHAPLQVVQRPGPQTPLFTLACLAVCSSAKGCRVHRYRRTSSSPCLLFLQAFKHCTSGADASRGTGPIAPPSVHSFVEQSRPSLFVPRIWLLLRQFAPHYSSISSFPAASGYIRDPYIRDPSFLSSDPLLLLRRSVSIQGYPSKTEI